MDYDQLVVNLMASVLKWTSRTACTEKDFDLFIVKEVSKYSMRSVVRSDHSTKAIKFVVVRQITTMEENENYFT
jgi:hypothetical protein